MGLMGQKSVLKMLLLRYQEISKNDGYCTYEALERDLGCVYIYYGLRDSN